MDDSKTLIDELEEGVVVLDKEFHSVSYSNPGARTLNILQDENINTTLLQRDD